MNQVELCTASELINRFQILSGVEGVSGQATLKDALEERKSTSPAYNEVLTALVSRFGHDATVQNYILLGLDDIQDRKPLQTVRNLTSRLADKACALKTEFAAGSEQAKGFEAFEERLAILWRHMMKQDEYTPFDQRMQEYINVRDHASSPALKAQLSAVKDFVRVLSYSR